MLGATAATEDSGTPRGLVIPVPNQKPQRVAALPPPAFIGATCHDGVFQPLRRLRLPPLRLLILLPASMPTPPRHRNPGIQLPPPAPPRRTETPRRHHGEREEPAVTPKPASRLPRREKEQLHDGGGKVGASPRPPQHLNRVPARHVPVWELSSPCGNSGRRRCLTVASTVPPRLPPARRCHRHVGRREPAAAALDLCPRAGGLPAPPPPLPGYG